MNSTQCHVSQEAFPSGWWEQTLFPALCEYVALFSGWYFPPATGIFILCMPWLELRWILERTFCRSLQISLSASLSPFQDSVLWTLSTLVFLDPQHRLLYSRSPLCSVWIPPPCTTYHWKLSQSSKPVTSQGSHHLFSISQRPQFIACCPVSCVLLFYIFLIIYIVLNLWQEKFSPCNSILSRSKTPHFILIYFYIVRCKSV